MKKILGILLAIVLVAAGWGGWRFYQAGRYLKEVGTGKTYTALGIKLEVGPTQGGVQGWSRLKPFVQISQVKLDLSRWGVAAPILLGAARLTTNLWERGNLWLVLEPGAVEGKEMKVADLAFELGIPDRILGVRAESIKFLNQTERQSETIALQRPQLYMEGIQGWIPEGLFISWEETRFQNLPKDAPPSDIKLGPISMGYRSKVEGHLRKWESYFKGKEGTILAPKGEGKVHPWQYEFQGSMVNLPEEKFREIGNTVMRHAQLLFGAMKAETQSDPLVQLQTIREVTNQLRQFLREWQPKVESVRFKWGGLLFQESGGKNSARVNPLHFAIQFREPPDGMEADTTGGLEKLTLAVKDWNFEMEGLQFKQKLKYNGLSYAAWLDYFLQYYTVTLSAPQDILKFGMAPVLENFSKIYSTYLATMADQGGGELSLGRLEFRNPRYQTLHRGASLSYAMGEKSWTSRVRDDFDSIVTGDESRSIRQGKIDLVFDFFLPWKALIESSRKALANPDPATNWATVFSSQTSGLDWKWVVDLGTNYFGIQLNLKLLADVGALWTGSLNPLIANPALVQQQVGRFLTMSFVKGFLQSGSADLAIKIERFSKLQAAMDKIKSGSSLSLNLLGPYMVLDPKADTLSIIFSLKNGEIHLNGQRRPDLEAMLKKVL